MTREEQALVRIFFQKQIHEADGQNLMVKFLLKIIKKLNYGNLLKIL